MATLDLFPGPLLSQPVSCCSCHSSPHWDCNPWGKMEPRTPTQRCSARGWETWRLPWSPHSYPCALGGGCCSGPCCLLTLVLYLETSHSLYWKDPVSASVPGAAWPPGSRWHRLVQSGSGDRWCPEGQIRLPASSSKPIRHNHVRAIIDWSPLGPQLEIGFVCDLLYPLEREMDGPAAGKSREEAEAIGTCGEQGQPGPSPQWKGHLSKDSAGESSL